tara:strand:- start:121 stop:1047 length:927 start_codon:yes stop_codon:yes gene_type:complete
MFTREELTAISKRIKEHSIIKRTLMSSFKGLVLNEKDHVYTINGNKLTSTSKYISQFEATSFNPHIISHGVTRGQNKKVYEQRPYLSELSSEFLLNKNQVLVRYKLMADQAIAMGNRVHYFSEMYPFFIKAHCDQEDAVFQWFKKYLGPDSKYVYIGSELRIFDPNTQKGGTIDLLLYNTKTKKLVICDWKTNHKSLLMGYKGQKLTGPFSHLINCPYTKYSLQLSDYKNMIEMNTDFEVEDMFIIHLYPVALDYMSKYKNKSSYTFFKDYLLKAKTPKYTLLKALDLTQGLKDSYQTLSNKNNKPAF